MLLDAESAKEADIIEADITAHKPDTAYSARLSDEEQRYIWALLLKNNLVGQVWPVYSWDDDEPLYELLVDRELVVAELNHVSDLPITVTQLRTLMNRFGGHGPLKKRVDQFYAKRKDRRIRAQFHPSGTYIAKG